MAGEDHIGESIEDVYPLSPLQQGMLFNTLSNPGSGVDIEQVLCRLQETLDVPAFQRAWHCVVARHPVLRTNLRWEDLDEPRQEVHAQVELPWEEQDWRGNTVSGLDKCIEDFLQADRRRGFELTRAPLFRLILLRVGEAEYQLVWTIHHCVLDGRSYEMVLREAFAFYDAARLGRDMTLARPRPYRDYIDWLQQQDFGKSEPFWRETLKGFTAGTPLAVDHAPDTHEDSGAGKGTHEIPLSAQVTSALRALAQENHLTLNTIVQGAWALLLSRYSGEADVVFGVIRANRRSTIEGAEAMIGLFVNTLPLRVRVDPEAALIPWLKQLRQQWMTMRGHEQAPLVVVQGWSEVPAGSPLFLSTMMLENYDLNTELRKQGGAWSSRRIRVFSQTNYPVDLAAYDGTEMRLRIDFDRGRIDDTAAGRMIGHVRALLEAMASNPLQTLGELPLLMSAERDQLLVEWNQTASAYPGNSRIHELFETQVERTPEAIAVTFEDRQLTYRELNRRSNQLAHHLRKLRVGPDVLVGICAERSLEMVVGLLAILKAGGAYVPIDPTYPAERVAFMLNDAGAPVMLAQENLIQKLSASKATKIVSLDAPDGTMSPGNTHNLPRTAAEANLAYVIYTSGSTGRPKGAMIPHRAIVNHMRWMQSRFPMSERDCVLQKTEFSFDVSVWEFFGPLTVGARLLLARPGGHQDPAYLVDSIIRHQVTILQLVPSLLRALLETPELKNCHSLRHVFCGGEAMTEDIPGRFYAILDAGLHNMYGPTEAAIDSLYYSVPRDHVNKVVPIGRPVANTQAYVLDRRGQPVPVGVPGELYLGGVQVGRGYHNQPELTAERFVPDVFSNARGARLYKTGDRVRFLADGNIEFLGRIDHQVKLRGFRIELGEIERVLQQHPAMQECVVAMREDTPGDTRLVAYLTSTHPSPAPPGELRGFLKQRLPAYMLPASFVFLEAFPLTPNGKLDRNALPPPEATSPVSNEAYVAPRTPTERALAASWRKLLQLEQVGAHDNFFELGGHSLTLVRLVSEINWTHKTAVGLPDVIQNPTLEQMANLVDQHKPEDTRHAKVVRLRQGRAELGVYFINAGSTEFLIAQHMREHHPAFGTDARWPVAWRNALSDNRTSAFPSMQQLVGPYVAVLRDHIRSAPCVLAGLSFAGVMAFEAAHQLEKAGQKVELVILVDTRARRPSPHQVARNLWWQFWNQPPGDRLSQSMVIRARSLLHIAQWLVVKAKHKVRSSFNRPELDMQTLSTVLDEQGTPVPWGLVERLYDRIDCAYRPRRLDSRGVLFRTREVDADGRQAVSANDDSLGWENLFGRGLEIIPIAGRHDSIFREQAPTLGREIDGLLRRHWPDQDSKPSFKSKLQHFPVGIEALLWCAVAQAFAGSGIELLGDGIAVMLSEISPSVFSLVPRSRA